MLKNYSKPQTFMVVIATLNRKFELNEKLGNDGI